MTKADKMDRLIDSAIAHFAEQGYDGASLRDIAADADVPLSAIHNYFSSKIGLYSAVVRQASTEVDSERFGLLNAAMPSGGGPASLEAILHAMTYPIVRRAMSDSKRQRQCLVVLRDGVPDRVPTERRGRVELGDRSRTRFIREISRACPSLAWPEAVWAYSFVLGSIFSWQLVDHLYDHLLEEATPTVNGVTNDLVAFCTAGIRSMARAKREQAPVHRLAPAKRQFAAARG